MVLSTEKSTQQLAEVLSAKVYLCPKFKHWFLLNEFFLIECLCNKFGTISCKEGDGVICVAKCKPGYRGTQCESCESKDLIVSGTNGFVDDNGQGVKCSKSLFQIKSQN